jgi:molecular chaperone HtpG
MTDPTTAPSADTGAPEKHGFQAEVRELLQLMIHSLYSHREIFLRELLSNASDANDKLRFLALAQPDLMAGESDLKVWVDYDAAKGTLSIRDNGIGMTREEAIAHLGTIAKSGTGEFFKRLTGDQQKDSQLIGQFGVGFYSAFIVAEEVEVFTRKAGEPASAGVRWASKADGEFTVSPAELPERGTRVVLHLKGDAKEFADGWRLRSLVRRYSDHIAFPVLMRKEGEATLDWEAANQAQALWIRPRIELTDDDYKGFYRHVTHDFADPLAWSHNKVEGKREYTSLLYIPARAPFDLYQRDAARGLKLYVRRVFIMDDAEQFLPNYLRFVRGVLDSSDLPLNVSREILQQSRDVEAIRNGSVKKVLGLLEDLAENEKEKYERFWSQFGRVLKEGVGEDFANRERIAKLLRFASTHADTDVQSVSLTDYVARMKEGQDKIYYITADSFAAARNSPHLEIFRKKGVEVLLLSDRVDEWVVSSLTQFEDKSLVSVAKGDLDLGKLEDEQEKEAVRQDAESLKPLTDRIRQTLGERVQEVRVTHRLTDSPACLVAEQHAMGMNLERLLKAAGQSAGGSKPILEVNPQHPIVLRLKGESDDARFSDWSNVLFDQALLAEGGQLEDPASFVRRVNQLMLAMAG